MDNIKIEDQIKVMDAFRKGDGIEYRQKGCNSAWKANPLPKWNWEDFEYRIKLPWNFYDNRITKVQRFHRCSETGVRLTLESGEDVELMDECLGFLRRMVNCK